MPVIRGFALSLAALAALYTLSPHAAGQVAASADPATQIQIGNEAFEAARYQEAIDAYNRAIESSDPALVMRARKGKVRTALRVAEFELARVEAETLTAGPNSDAESQTLLGDALWGNGLFDEADRTYRAALEQEPESSRARFGLARSLATTSRLDEALKEALQTATLSPKDPEVHALVGLVYERLNRYDEAADAYDRYIALLPSSETSTMAAISQGKVRLLRSFKGRVPLQVTETAGRVYRVPFRMVNRKIVLQGRVNRTPVEFVLDTGSERTGVSDVTARRAGVVSVTATLTAGVGVASLRRLELGRADSIEVGALRIRNVPLSIRTVMRGALPRWQSESFSPLSLGYSLVVDYQRREVLLSRALPEGPADIRLPMRMNRLPLVRGLLNSKYPAYFVVDTGGELISISAETALSLAMPPVRRIPLKVFGMSGVDENAFLLPGVNLDFEEIEYRNVGLAVLNLRAPSVLLGFQLGGIVGHRFLSDYRVSMDMERSELRLQKVQAVATR
ncbi:MAG: tetratricopeptide repeat protein [Acidobacteria bacterium]|nr:tetratricopeptide repeat protein [Acidobacteriota bacterium]